MSFGGIIEASSMMHSLSNPLLHASGLPPAVGKGIMNDTEPTPQTRAANCGTTDRPETTRPSGTCPKHERLTVPSAWCDMRLAAEHLLHACDQLHPTESLTHCPYALRKQDVKRTSLSVFHCFVNSISSLKFKKREALFSTRRKATSPQEGVQSGVGELERFSLQRRDLLHSMHES